MGVGKFWVLALALLGAEGCSPTDEVFACTESQQCDSVGVPGSCESNGFCSFPDPECPSGRRYGDLAGPLSGTCVDTGTNEGSGTTTNDAAEGTTSNSTTSSVGSTEVGSSTGDTTDALSTEPTAGETTTAVSGDASTGTTTSSGEETDGSSSTGEVMIDGLVGWWRLNDDPTDGMLDSTGNGHDGVCLEACPEFDVGGGFYRFDGTQILRIPGAAFGADEFTVALWARPSLMSAVPDPIVFTKPTGDSLWNAWGLHFDQGISEFEFVIGNPDANIPVTAANPDVDWHHYAGRFDGTIASLFVDGALVSSVTIPDGYFVVDDNDVYLGGDFDDGGPPEPRFRGDVDDVRYYNVALTQSEIASLAAAAD